MRIVIVHTDFRIYWEARLSALTGYLKLKDIDLVILEISGSGSPYSFASNILTHPENWHCLFPLGKMEDISPVFAKKTLLKKLNEIMPDIVISGPIAFPSGAAAVLWTLRNKRKVIVFDDARLIDVPRVWWVDYIKKKVYSAVDAVFCPSPDWITTFSHFGFSSDRLFYGVDVVENKFWEKSENLTFDSKKGSKYFLAIGRQIPKKNFGFMLKAYSKYARSVKNPFRLVVVGEGPENSLLKEIANSNCIEDMVDFSPFTTQERLRILYQRATWLILPSIIGETWGLVVNEAMASGLPVLVSDQAGCSSTLVKNGENGFTFSPNDEDSLIKLLIKAGTISDAELRRMGLKSRQIISEWDLGHFCAGIYNAIQYVSVIDKRKTDIIGRFIINLWRGRYRPV